MESPSAVTPWPAGGAVVVVVLPSGGTTTVDGAARCLAVGTMLVTRGPGLAAEASTSPTMPRVQTRALSDAAPTTSQPNGRRRSQDQSCWRTRLHWRPRAPCRTGSSTYRQERAASARVTPIWRDDRTTLGREATGVVRTITG